MAKAGGCDYGKEAQRNECDIIYIMDIKSKLLFSFFGAILWILLSGMFVYYFFYLPIYNQPVLNTGNYSLDLFLKENQKKEIHELQMFVRGLSAFILSYGLGIFVGSFMYAKKINKVKRVDNFIGSAVTMSLIGSFVVSIAGLFFLDNSSRTSIVDGWGLFILFEFMVVASIATTLFFLIYSTLARRLIRVDSNITQV